MKIAGTNVIDQPVDKVWDALLDPAVLVAHHPRLRAARDHGRQLLHDDRHRRRGRDQGHLQRHRARSPTSQPAPSRWSCGSTAPVRPARSTPTSTSPSPSRRRPDPVAYDADAVVGGMVGGVGQRMLSSVSKRMAGEFFGNVGQAIAPTTVRRAGRDHHGRGTRLHRSRQAAGPRLQGRLRQGHRGRRRAGRARRRHRFGLRPPALVTSRSTPPRATRQRPSGPGRSRPASCSTCTSSGSPSATPSSTRSSRWTRSGPGQARRQADESLAAGTRSVRCTGCRSRSRTPTPSRAGGRRSGRRSSRTSCPSRTS